jgi:hypothetical protein
MGAVVASDTSSYCSENIRTIITSHSHRSERTPKEEDKIKFSSHLRENFFGNFIFAVAKIACETVAKITLFETSVLQKMYFFCLFVINCFYQFIRDGRVMTAQDRTARAG